MSNLRDEIRGFFGAKARPPAPTTLAQHQAHVSGERAKEWEEFRKYDREGPTHDVSGHTRIEATNEAEPKEDN